MLLELCGHGVPRRRSVPRLNRLRYLPKEKFEKGDESVSNRLNLTFIAARCGRCRLSGEL